MELFQQANELNERGQFIEAEKLYDRLLEQNHDNPGLLATMGTMYLKMDRCGLAIHMLERAAKKLKQGDIICNLALAYKYAGQIDKAMECFERAIQGDASAEALANYAGVLTNTGNPSKVLALADRALKKDSQCAMGHWNRALALLELGDFAEGFDEHEWGFEAKIRTDRGAEYYPYWDGTDNKSLWVFGEQGLGDEIMFASMLPDLMKKNDVIFECHPRLKTLFEKSFPGLTCYGTREEKGIQWTENHKIDARVSIGSLGKWYRRERSAFPGTHYLNAEPLEKPSKFRVGISWTGGMKIGRVVVRTIPLSWWESILSVANVEFVSLQYTDCETEIDVVNQSGYDIRQFPEAKANDYYETARLVKSCDLVISCCTSVIHLAGALGVPCWVMVPNKPAWRYGVTGGMPWYRSVRLYRQPAGGVDTWIPVVQRVGYDLDNLVNVKQKEAA